MLSKLILVYDGDGGGFGAQIYNLFQSHALALLINYKCATVNPFFRNFYNHKDVVCLSEEDISALDFSKAIFLDEVLSISRSVSDFVSIIDKYAPEIILSRRHHYHPFFTRYSASILDNESRKDAFASFSKNVKVNHAPIKPWLSSPNMSSFREQFKFLAKTLIGRPFFVLHVRSLIDSPQGFQLYQQTAKEVENRILSSIENICPSRCIIYLLSDSHEITEHYSCLLESRGYLPHFIKTRGLQFHTTLSPLFGRMLFDIEKRTRNDDIELIRRQSMVTPYDLSFCSNSLAEWYLRTFRS